MQKSSPDSPPYGGALRPQTGPLGAGSRCFGYLRASPGPQQENSTTDQRREIEQFAAERHWQIVRFYEDDDRSGSSVAGRAQFQEMIAACHEKPAPVDAIVVWAFSRFGRDELEGQFYMADIQLRGIQLVSLTQTVPKEFAQVTMAMIRFSDAQKLDELRTGVKRGQIGALMRGYLPGTTAPVGYKQVREAVGVHRNGLPRFGMRWEIDEEAAPVVREAFRRRAEGATIRALLRDLRPLTTRQGMLTMFRNKAYIGVFVYADQEFPGIVPPLVDRATWDACQTVGETKAHPRRVGSRFLLSGLLRCGYCGRAMSGISSVKKSKNWQKDYYICGRRNSSMDCHAPIVPARDLEEAVKAIVFGDLLQPESFANLLAEVRAQEHVDETDARLKSVEREIATGERAIRDLLDLAGTGVAVQAIAERIRSHEERLRVLRSEYASIATPKPILNASEDDIRAFLDDLRLRLRSPDLAVQRWVLAQVVGRLAYGPELTVEFKVPD